MSTEQDEPEYELEMPFVNVRSRGGLYDDEAYVAGFEMGQLSVYLEQAERVKFDRAIQAANTGQADLIAMKNGWRLEVYNEVDGWAQCSFHPTAKGDAP